MHGNPRSHEVDLQRFGELSSRNSLFNRQTLLSFFVLWILTLQVVTCHARFSCRKLTLELAPAFAIRTKNMKNFRYFVLYFLRKRSNFIIISLRIGSAVINFYDSEHLFGYEPKLIVNLSLARATPKIILFVPKL